jgi:hypothetical protein
MPAGIAPQLLATAQRRVSFPSSRVAKWYSFRYKRAVMRLQSLGHVIRTEGVATNLRRLAKTVFTPSRRVTPRLKRPQPPSPAPAVPVPRGLRRRLQIRQAAR